MSVRLSGVAATDLGLGRENNEDSVYAGQRLFVVADGVGGQPAGEVASQLVVAALEPLEGVPEPDDPLEALTDAVAEANRTIRAHGSAESGQGGMATTLTALLHAGDRLALVHVGDSRAYRLRDGELRQLTTDHTYVQSLVDRGAITADEAWRHPLGSLVTQVVQGDPLRPQVELLDVKAGDRYLLCSDGLSDVVPTGTIRDALRDAADPAQCADHLIKLALAAGGPDNISVVVADAAG